MRGDDASAGWPTTSAAQIANTVKLLGAEPSDQAPIPLARALRARRLGRAAAHDDEANVGIRDGSDAAGRRGTGRARRAGGRSWLAGLPAVLDARELRTIRC